MTAVAVISQKMTEGAWVIDDLKPLFRQALIKALPVTATSERLPTYVLAAARYGLSPIETGELDAYVYDRYLAAFGHSIQTLDAHFHESKAASADLNQIRQIAPKLAELYQATIEAIVLTNGVGFTAASSPKLFGLIIITDRYCGLPKSERMLSMIHELAHQELFLINLIDRLIPASTEQNLIYSPFQERDRPPIGRLHACHVLFRMVQFIKTATKKYFPEEQLMRLKIELKACIASIDKENELTHFGRKLIEIYLSA